MKGKKCLNLLSQSRVFSAFLLLLFSLLLSLFPVNKVNALTYNVNLNFESNLNSGGFNIYYKYGLNGTLKSSSASPFILNRANDDEVDDAPSDNAYVRYICSINSHSVTTDDLLLITLVSSVETQEEDVIGSIKGYYSSDNFTILDISENFSYDTLITRLKTGLYSPGTGFNNQPYAVEQVYYPYQVYSYDILLRPNSSGTYPICIGRSGGGAGGNLYLIPPAHTVGGFQFRLNPSYAIRKFTFDTSSEDMNEKDEQDRENIENQQSDSQDSSDDSQEEAESTGTTLLAAFSSFVTAITSASPSNCNLLMNMGNLNLGNVNLCQLSPPVEFQAIASIFLILFCVPLSIATARKVINLFRSFQT